MPVFYFTGGNSSRFEGEWFENAAIKKHIRHIDSNAELYCDHRFVELESLSPLGKLEPGAEVYHRETWELFEGLESFPSDVQNTISYSQ